MDNKGLPVSLGNFNYFDSQLSQMQQRFRDEWQRMDTEMDQVMSNIETGQVCDSTVITNHGNQKTLKLTFDVSQFRPEEVTVVTADDKIIVRARHEEKSKNKNVVTESNREYSLPRGTDPDTIDISISDDGVLIAYVPITGQLTSATYPAIQN